MINKKESYIGLVSLQTFFLSPCYKCILNVLLSKFPLTTLGARHENILYGLKFPWELVFFFNLTNYNNQMV